MPMRHQLLLLLLPCLVASARNDLLKSGTELYSQLIELDSEVVRYQLAGVESGRSYNLRISWPATIPAIIGLALEVNARHGPRGSARKLLDTEQLSFRAGADKEYFVNMTAKRRSLHRDGPHGGVKQLVYNIVLEPMLLGLPVSTWPVALTCLIAILAVLLLVPYWIKYAVPRMLAVMLGTETNTTALGNRAGARKRKQ